MKMHMKLPIVFTSYIAGNVTLEVSLDNRFTFVPLAWNRVHKPATGSVPVWSLQLRGKSFIDLYSHDLTMCILVHIYEDNVE